jgi:Cdc6-like AAA superfamily ATPase
MPWATPEQIDSAVKRVEALEARVAEVESDVRRMADVCRKIVETFKKAKGNQ